MDVQIITTPAGEELVSCRGPTSSALPPQPPRRWKRRDDIRHAQDILARVARGEEEVFPAAVVEALLDGPSPVKALREHRGMTQKDLASAAGINAMYLSQIERGERTGSPATLRALAMALRVDADLLLRG